MSITGVVFGGGAFVAGTVVGAAVVAIGSRHTCLPADCPPYDYYGRRYYYCDDVYYQPVYKWSGCGVCSC
jgi:hypothetical protein